MTRFVCEWCYEKVQVTDRGPRHLAVLAHLSSCPRRSQGMTLKQIAGLAAHIAGLMVEQDQPVTISRPADVSKKRRGEGAA